MTISEFGIRLRQRTRIQNNRLESESSFFWQSKIGNLILLGLSVVVFVLVRLDAQQAGKVSRIGFLDASTASGIAVLVDAFRQEMGKLGWIEGKISPSSIDLQRERLTACLSLWRTWFVLRLI